MSKNKRKRYSAEFKAKVALEALKGERSDTLSEEQVKELHAKIGQLTVERDFLAKAFGR